MTLERGAQEGKRRPLERDENSVCDMKAGESTPSDEGN